MRVLAKTLLVTAAVWLLPGSAFAAIVAGGAPGNVCPSVGQNVGNNVYTVNDAISCFYDNEGPPGGSSNIQGSNAEATLFEPFLPGSGWVGAGQNDLGQAGGKSGSFNLTTFAGQQGFAQIAVGVKDGSFPFWAIFVLPAGDFASLWSIVGGGLSHFAIYGLPSSTTTTTTTTTGAAAAAGGEPVIPEPASLLLLGTGLGVVAARARRAFKNRPTA